MAFKGITFAGQNVTPKNDGGFYEAHNGDGILWGCSMAISGDDLVIQSGEIIAGGRICAVDGATNVDLSGRLLSTGYARVILNYDMTQGEGSQWYTTFDESATTTFPALTQDAINDTGDLYQVTLAVVQISGGNLTSIYSESGVSPLRVISKTGAKCETQIEDEYTNIRSYKSDGTPAGGLVVSGSGDYTAVWNNGGDILLRPNGNASTTGQVQLTTGGQLIGGCLVDSYDNTTSRSINAGTYATVATLTLDTTGIYLVDCFVSYKANTNTETYKRIGIANVSNSLGIRTSDYYSGTTEARTYHFTCIQIPSQVTNYVNFYNGTVAGTIQEVYCRVARLA